MGDVRRFCIECEYYDRLTKKCRKNGFYVARKSFCEKYKPKKLCFECKEKETCDTICDAVKAVIPAISRGKLRHEVVINDKNEMELYNNE